MQGAVEAQPPGEEAAVEALKPPEEEGAAAGAKQPLAVGAAAVVAEPQQVVVAAGRRLRLLPRLQLRTCAHPLPCG